MSKARTTTVLNPGKQSLFIGIAIVFLVVVGFLYQQRYIYCLFLDPASCMQSQKYESPNALLTFRYPKDYPLTSKTGEEMVKEYGFDTSYLEWVNFSSEFYPNAGGDRLGSIVVTKDSGYSSVQEFENKAEESFNKLPEELKASPPTIEHLRIGGKDAVRITTPQQPSSFNPPSDEYIIVDGGRLYRISFDFNDYYHKESAAYYEKGKKIILSTLLLK